MTLKFGLRTGTVALLSYSVGRGKSRCQGRFEQSQEVPFLGRWNILCVQGARELLVTILGGSQPRNELCAGPGAVFRAPAPLKSFMAPSVFMLVLGMTFEAFDDSPPLPISLPHLSVLPSSQLPLYSCKPLATLRSTFVSLYKLL